MKFWEKIVGPTLGRQCEPAGYDRTRLYIWVKSSPRMQEMRFFEETIKQKVNEYVGRTWVKSIRFTLDRSGIPAGVQISDSLFSESAGADSSQEK